MKHSYSVDCDCRCCVAERERRSSQSRANNVSRAYDHQKIRLALKLLDNIATSDASMGGDDIESLCDARTLLAQIVGAAYNEDTNRHD